MANDLTSLLMSKGVDQLNKGVDVGGDIIQGVQAGVQLATAKEQVEKQKTALADQKADLMVKQASTANSLLTNLARANPAIAKKMVPQIREKLLNLGLDPNIADFTISDDANRQRQIYFSQLASGKINPNSAASFMQAGSDVGAWDQAGQALDLQKKNQHAEKMQANQIASNEKIAAMNNQTKLAGKAGGGLTVGEKARDTKFAKNYTDFFDAGGAAGIEANLASIDKSLTTLEQGGTTQAEGFVPDMIGNVAFPKTAEVRSNVTAVLIQGLKETFGGQLSDGERKAMVESAYVASANPKQNADRIRALKNKIMAGALAKEKAGQYFEENGTLKGFKGTKSFDIGGKTLNLDPSGGDTASLDIETKKKQAIDAGYSPEEVDAYVQNLMNASK